MSHLLQFSAANIDPCTLQLTAYKLMAVCNPQGTNFLSAVDGFSRSVTRPSKAHHSVKQRSHVHILYRFQLGHKSVSSYGFLVATNAEAAVQAPINNMLTKR